MPIVLKGYRPVKRGKSIGVFCPELIIKWR